MVNEWLTLPAAIRLEAAAGLPAAGLGPEGVINP